MDEERACRETALSSGPSADGLILLVVVTPSLVSFAGSFGQTHGQNPQDLPELFMGKPRPYSVHDIEKGMQVRVTKRQSWKRRIFCKLWTLLLPTYLALQNFGVCQDKHFVNVFVMS